MIVFSNKLISKIVKDFYNRYANWKVPKQPSDWGKMLANSDVVISAWDGEDIVGMMRALTDTVRWATILDVLVHPNYRQKGLGTELLKRLLAEEIMHVRTIFIGTENAKGFYAKNGFENASHKGDWTILVQKEYEL